MRVENEQAKGAMSDVRKTIVVMTPVLQSLNARVLKEETRCAVTEVWQCLKNAKTVYEKYSAGYSLRKPWVTPACIKEKAATQNDRVRWVFMFLQLSLGVAQHNLLFKDHEVGPAAVSRHAAAAESWGYSCGPWEIPETAIDFKRNPNTGLPTVRLGQGSFGVVGLGYYTEGGITQPVAVKSCFQLAEAHDNPEVLRIFKKEVSLMGTLDHPNICQCYGAVTLGKDGDLLMWSIMEKLDITLQEAITHKKCLQLGRDAPEQYADILSSIVSAVAYLHSPTNGTPIVHRGSGNLYN